MNEHQDTDFTRYSRPLECCSGNVVTVTLDSAQEGMRRSLVIVSHDLWCGFKPPVNEGLDTEE